MVAQHFCTPKRLSKEYSIESTKQVTSIAQNNVINILLTLILACFPFVIRPDGFPQSIRGKITCESKFEFLEKKTTYDMVMTRQRSHQVG